MGGLYGVLYVLISSRLMGEGLLDGYFKWDVILINLIKLNRNKI